MIANSKFTERESTTINILKSVAILSVIAAHVVPLVETDTLCFCVSSLWTIFGHVGVIIFLVVGGFLYTRKEGDNAIFWKKKTFRIFIPWLFCSFLTYLLFYLLSDQPFSLAAYFKWFLGSGTWYYYATIYTLFIFIFKWFYKNDIILYSLIGIQTIVFILKSVGISTTIPLDFFTDYLNPLHWIGYFSIGIIVRKKRLDIILRKNNIVIILSAIISIICCLILLRLRIHTYFNLITSIFCISSSIVILGFSYWIAKFKVANHISKAGEYSYCIYLLHMQIVQSICSKIPAGIIQIICSPFIGLLVMLFLICIGLWFCKKLPFGDKIKMLVGL